jgi:regulatory protein
VGLSKPNRSEARSARKVALDLLARREHAREELRCKLAARGFDEAEITSALNALEAKRWLNEARFAENYIFARQARGFGPVRIRMELKERGVADSIIDEHLDAQADQWRDLLYAQYRKRYGDKPAHEYKERARRARFLQQRGFPVDMIGRLLDELNKQH